MEAAGIAGNLLHKADRISSAAADGIISPKAAHDIAGPLHYALIRALAGFSSYESSGLEWVRENRKISPSNYSILLHLMEYPVFGDAIIGASGRIGSAENVFAEKSIEEVWEDARKGRDVLPGDAYTDEANAGRLFRYFTLNFRAEHGRYPLFRDYREAGLDGLMAHYGYDKFKAFYLSGLMRRDSEYYDQELDYAPWEAFERLGRDYWKEGPNRAKAILNTQLAALTSDKPHFASYKDYNRSRLKGLLNYCSREK